ncbi:DUF4450 domain-containing protein [uncultured Draconibacterium sp.]|uniref:DUF4450 domain-containing protein n=1 Tax=uncultured Draconibacterium sp. TaxID=1573823 RepID=UPI0025D534DD|nr:DUF4450 domain-containing protein [uncultured Draconibacterium sp.]
MIKNYINIILLFSIALLISCGQKTPDKKATNLWHNESREIRYQPDGKGFVITNGTKRFNRALYGTNTGFRVEAGDLPEFAIYMPRLGGTFRLGLIQADSSKWLINAETIKMRYEAGSITYQIEDPLLGTGKLYLHLLAMADADGFILKAEAKNVSEETELFWAFGGASGKRFSREGDLGADPESVFYLKPENCTSNEYFIRENSFNLYYGSGRTLSDNEVYENNYQPTPEEIKATRLKEKKRLFGLVPINSDLKLGDASFQNNPLGLYQSQVQEAPVITGKTALTEENYFLILNPDTKIRPAYSEIPQLFQQASFARKEIADRIKIETPDKYINAVGATLSTAADAVWDGKSFMHGAIAWRMPLNGWRGAYAADWLGWHDRAKTHFRGYFQSQYTAPASGPSTPDEKTHLSRQKEEKGTALFTDGYISRRPGGLNKPHHYDMNLVFISQLLSHFRWTGDLEFLRESWPVLERHLAWEKRCFDANNDGLYDAYASIWASDALQYSGGGVTHSSAYNYRANLVAAELAPLIGKDPKSYLLEAEKIKTAVNESLWLHEKGWFAEYKDLLGNQLVHPSAALWTVYHAIDEKMANPFQAYQSTQYIDKNIPHIPIEAEGLETSKYYTLATSNWMPYTWSINNVAFAEVLHIALAYWQSGRPEKAFELTKSTFLDYMFLGSSPGNFGQLSYYDAFRGELYRDFADPVAMAARAFVEGMFGISPDIVNEKLSITPGWPVEWSHTSIQTPDIKLNFKRNNDTDIYEIESNFGKKLQLNLALNARKVDIKSVTINGETRDWTFDEKAIGSPKVIVKSKKGNKFKVKIEWSGSAWETPKVDEFYALNENINIQLKKATLVDIYDPQNIFDDIEKNEKTFSAKLKGKPGWRTAFLKFKQNDLQWWHPLSFDLRPALCLVSDKQQAENKLAFKIQNNTKKTFNGKYSVNGIFQNITIPAKSISDKIIISNKLVPGSNKVEIIETNITENVVNWNVSISNKTVFEKVNITEQFNDRITNIFNEQYFSPRSPYPTLSIPVQGIGDWCSYRETEEIDDSGLRKKAGAANEIKSAQGIPFQTPGEAKGNILFTSKWDNYPDSVEIPLSGKASHLYLLMAGSVHHMQINMVNGWIKVNYKDGSKDVLPLKSPENWWPIEQDYYQDGFAFKVNAPQPPRLYLKTGEWHLDSYDILKKNGTNKIEGGAASMLDLPLNPKKELQSLKVITNTNDVVIGLMAATLKTEN